MIVARAIDDRMGDLGITQRTLIQRSGLSKAVVREIQHHVVERRRSPRTLEALSVALEWHPDYLLALSRNDPVPDQEHSRARAADIDRVVDRLDAFERNLEDLHKKLDELTSMLRSSLKRG